jgi:hypothetical protein
VAERKCRAGDDQAVRWQQQTTKHYLLAHGGRQRQHQRYAQAVGLISQGARPREPDDGQPHGTGHRQPDGDT